jgi:hypothetical protein
MCGVAVLVEKESFWPEVGKPQTAQKNRRKTALKKPLRVM